MWLQYGVSPSKTLIRIEEVESGKTDLYCPYCGGFLTAKKGKVKQHHFSHTEKTCYPVATKVQLPQLPLYDNFNIQLSGQSLQLLKTLWLSIREKDWGTPFFPELKPLIKARLLQKNPYHQPPDYEFTPLGQIPVGALPLAEFNTLQEPLLLSALSERERKAELARALKSLNRHQQLTHLWLYRAQLRRILSHRLYFLQVRTDNLLLHKIGVTKRSIEERLIEIKRDLCQHFSSVEVQVLGIWEHRGNVELYFKHRYQEFNYPNRESDRILQVC